MTVKELIESLKQFDEDLDVVVQHRDAGGYYDGVDWDVQPYLEDGNVVL